MRTVASRRRGRREGRAGTATQVSECRGGRSVVAPREKTQKRRRPRLPSQNQTHSLLSLLRSTRRRQPGELRYSQAMAGGCCCARKREGKKNAAVKPMLGDDTAPFLSSLSLLFFSLPRAVLSPPHKSHATMRTCAPTTTRAAARPAGLAGRTSRQGAPVAALPQSSKVRKLEEVKTRGTAAGRGLLRPRRLPHSGTRASPCTMRGAAGPGERWTTAFFCVFFTAACGLAMPTPHPRNALAHHLPLTTKHRPRSPSAPPPPLRPPC